MKRLHLFLTILAVIIGCLGAHAERWNYQVTQSQFAHTMTAIIVGTIGVPGLLVML